MNKTAISISNIGKEYKIGEKVEYGSLREDLTNFLSNGIKRLVSKQDSTKGEEKINAQDYFWSLKDITLDIGTGEIMGIIGRNGAGKSTLLKIIAGITEPTEGRINIYGRIGSLLEVGTGFHQELTGRENIYLNGAILGMRRTEIDRKFDEIVAFSEVEKFIDTPVKFYSTGMRVRLGFSVAAHLEPEILLIDEVLAVGDAAFQKKCLGKLNNVATSEGRTVLFVSHDMAAILSLCNRAVLLEEGRIMTEGITSEVVEQYFKTMTSNETVPLSERTDRDGDGSVIVMSLKIENEDTGKPIRPSSNIKFTLGYKSESAVNYLRVEIIIRDFQTRVPILFLDSETTPDFPHHLPPEGNIVCVTDNVSLSPGKCIAHIKLRKGMIKTDDIEDAGQFSVETENVHASGKIPTRKQAMYILKNEWSVEK